MLKIAWSNIYAHPLPEGHRFPMEKYDLIPEQLLYEGTIREENLFLPEALKESVILKAHSLKYWHDLDQGNIGPREMRKTGFPWSEELVRREIVISGGTLQAARYAKEYGIAMNISGGTHHAFRDRGEGFCLLNDFCMAAMELLDTRESEKIMIIDLDVHQGNGTAEIMANEDRVFTFSMHCEANYPMQKESSDLDIPLPHGISDDEYLNSLTTTLPPLLDQVEPDLVFYLSGVDVLETDKLGKLSLTREGCRQRDRFVFELLRKHGIPVAVAMGGGYSAKVSDIVEAHCNTFRLAQELWF